jgi:hypothetical protein
MARPQARDLGARLLEPLRYGDVFEYPLTGAEIQRYCTVRVELVEVLSRLRTDPDLIAQVEEKDGFFCLRGRAHLAAARRLRAAYARILLERARPLLARLSRLPFVRGLALTGSLALENVEVGADVDLMILTAPGRLWTVHLPVRILERGVRRLRLCANYYLAIDRLALPERDLFTARELIQARPWFGRAAWSEFYRRNDWVARIFPNWSPPDLELVPELPPAAGFERLLAAGLGERLERRLRRLFLRRLARNPRLRDGDWSERGVVVEDGRFMLHMALYHRLLPRIYHVLGAPVAGDSE